jgi:two-component system cell cycle response regulator DivK
MVECSSPDHKGASNSGEPSKNEPVSGSTTILVVEDNAGNFMLIARMLESLNIKCVWKTSGYEVVEFASSISSIDLVLMDIRLPYEDGYGALRKIRQSERLRSLPVVAVTAVAGVDQMNAAKLAGFDGFIGKPLDPDRFPDQIRRILAGKPVWEYA